MACINVNLPEFETLAKSFPDKNKAYAYALKWQEVNKSDSIPTYEQVVDLQKQLKKEKDSVKNDFIQALTLNLAINNLAVKLEDGVYLLGSMQGTEELSIENKKAIISNFLYFNNLPTDFITYEKIGKRHKLKFNKNKLKDVSRISKKKDFNYSRTKKLLDHLTSVFPNVKYRYLDYFEAALVFEELPESMKKGRDFKNVKSFFNPLTGEVILIKGAVTDNIAAEEMLHPFVAALKEDNLELFNNLLEEIKTIYPKLYNDVVSAYATKEIDGDLANDIIDQEVLTKGLSDYFNKNFEEKPTSKTKSLVRRFLDFISKIVGDFYSKLTGKTLDIKDINENTTVSDLIKMLNTDSLVFSFNIPEKMQVMYALSSNKERIISNALENATVEQQQVINGLFRNVRQSRDVFDEFTVGNIEDKGVNSDNDFVQLVEQIDAQTGKKIRKYVNLLNPSVEYTSVTESFNSFGKDDEGNYEFNLMMGNIFDAILEEIVLNKTLDEITLGLELNDKIDLSLLESERQENGEVIKTTAKGEIEKIYNQMVTIIESIASQDDILLPQVIVHTTSTDSNYPSIAGTIDLLLIKPDGKFQVIDLKTSKYTVKKEKAGLEFKYKKPWNIVGTLLNEQSKKFNDEVRELSTAQKHSLQLAMYARMLENMGMEMALENPFYTINFQIDVEGTKKEQKYKGNYTYEGKNAEGVNFRKSSAEAHPSSTSIVYSGYLIQDKVVVQKQDVDVQQDRNDQSEVIIKDNLNELETIKEQLSKFKEILISRKDAVSEGQNKIFISEKETVDYIKKIDKIMQMVSQALVSNSVSEARAAYTDILRTAISDARSFIQYLEDPQNLYDKDFLKYISNATNFARQFESLYMLKDSKYLKGSNIESLIFELQSVLNTLTKNEGEELSLANNALFDYVKQTVYDATSQDLTLDEVDEMMREGLDISGLEYWTRDLATSRDIHLRVMDKILKTKKLQIVEAARNRELRIREAANNLMRLSGIKDPEKLYDFMLNDDGTYIQKLSKDYSLLRNELLSQQYDSDGNYKSYIQIQNLQDATPEQIKYNLELYEIKRKRREFEQAEIIDQTDGSISKGKYHEYSQEFIDARNQFMHIKKIGGYYKWVRKDNVSDREFRLFKDKYYNTVEYVSLRFDGQNPTGETVTKNNFFPKQEFKKVREVSEDGVELFDARFKKLMNPTSELEKAQLEFYNMFTTYYEQLLKKLPKGEYYKMLGRIPVVRNRFATDLSKKSNGVIRIFAKLMEFINSIKEFFVSSSQFRAIATDEFGNLVDSVPIFFTGRLKDEAELQEIYDDIEALKKLRQSGAIGMDTYRKEISVLNGRRKAIEKRPSTNEISRDLGTSLLKFSLMAENYERMSEAEDIFNAFLSVIENKTYQPNGNFEIGYYDGKEFKKKGQKLGKQSNVYQRARKYMDMVLYEKDKVTKGKTDQLVNGLIKYTSLSYVSLNPFGSFNNYMYAKISNYIEAVGERYFSRKSYTWAEREFKREALSKLVERTSYIKGKRDSFYDPNAPLNKWEAFVDYLMMMDDKSDLREASFEFGKQSFFGWAVNKAYILQDTGEYNVQTKVGMSILKDIIVRDKQGKLPEISLYDAYVFDIDTAKTSNTFGLRLKEGYEDLVVIKAPDTLMVQKTATQGNEYIKEREFDDNFRFDLRNYIRETNKQIHGNYADVDRMVIQEANFGKLVAQFHKWVMPAINARFQNEYYDENLGHMEGRYISFLRVLGYLGEQLTSSNLKFRNLKQQYIDAQLDVQDKGKNEKKIKELEKKYENTYVGFQRSVREAVIIISIFLVKGLIDSFMDDDEDEIPEDGIVEVDLFREPEKEQTKFQKRLYNWSRWQTDRIAKDLSIYIPILPSSMQQAMKMIDSPFASTRTLGELGEALSYTFSTAAGYVYYSNEEFYADKDFVYQRGSRKGQLKVAKNWGDVIPLWYSIQKWISFDNITNFYIK